nr:immunoglobulin light chain junction region [Macaca mulatta]
CQHYHSTPYSF